MDLWLDYGTVRDLGWMAEESMFDSQHAPLDVTVNVWMK